MSSLSSKSAQEISDLLDEYGIKHGPVVDTTRSLYERKLREAMAKGKKTTFKSSPDKTYYREEEEEVTYVYRTPARSEGAGDSGSYMSSRPGWDEPAFEQETSYSAYPRSRSEYKGRDFVDEPYTYNRLSAYRNSTLTSTPMKSDQAAEKKVPKSSGLIPMWIQLVFFLAVAIFLYFVFSTMETNESLKGIE